MTISRLHGRTLQNMPINSPTKLATLIKRKGIRKVLLAIPSISRHRKRMLVDQLTHFGLEVLSIPSLSQLATGQKTVTDLRSVAIEDLLGREPSNPDPHLLEVSVKGKTVLVTGAGGSIGSELCRQIVALGSKKLILLERNEYALYSIDNELSRNRSGKTELHSVLGDAGDSPRLVQICRTHAVSTIFHAAAYKHVPMVESNLCAGVGNNLRSTRAVITAAFEAGIERLTLISTDKAVRPTNAMGASKRVCELLLQAAAAECPAGGPILSMVRFGNVLGSSGSVIPLFHQQIEKGGPVTVTHPAITRYFMTIPEAVQLVLQATGMAKGGDLFLLDMGEPVRIADLARQMIELSGLRVRDEETPDGDIAIQYTGLRPGEKLYEELLIGSEDQPTAHPLIRRANEPLRSNGHLQPLLDQLDQALASWDEEATSHWLQKLVPEYRQKGSPVRQKSLDALDSMNHTIARLPSVLRQAISRVPPATPRNLWLLLAAAVAVQNLIVFHTSQTAHTSVFALLVWGGALICFEDQIEDLDPRPVGAGLVLGTVILLWVMARTAVILHWEGILFALAPLAGVALALLCCPLRRLQRFRDPLLCLMMLPAFALMMRLIPKLN